jgi:Family of unknown function (DUF6011)
MSYQDAPATKIMATHCACCGKPLLDAKSVEIGIGPVCRKKYGYGADVPEDARKAANVLIHALAAAVGAGAVGLDVLKQTKELYALGFPKIADIFLHRGVGITIEAGEYEGTLRYAVRTPYEPAFNQASWMPGRFGKKLPVALSHSKRKVFHWLFPHTPEAKRRIFKALLACFPGALAFGPQGPFEVVLPAQAPAKTASEPEPQTPPTEVGKYGTCWCGQGADHLWHGEGMCDECFAETAHAAQHASLAGDDA